MNFAVCYDFMRMLKNINSDWEIKHQDELRKEMTLFTTILLEMYLTKLQSWIMGKALLNQI
jgi:hypothetical protein